MNVFGAQLSGTVRLYRLNRMRDPGRDDYVYARESDLATLDGGPSGNFELSRLHNAGPETPASLSGRRMLILNRCGVLRRRIAN